MFSLRLFIRVFRIRPTILSIIDSGIGMTKAAWKRWLERQRNPKGEEAKKKNFVNFKPSYDGPDPYYFRYTADRKWVWHQKGEKDEAVWKIENKAIKAKKELRSQRISLKGQANNQMGF